jgi:hypothetical protein
MIDTYMDRCDAASGFKPATSTPIWHDERYFNGQLYATMIDRNVAEARSNLEFVIDMLYEQQAFEIYRSFRELEFQLLGA